MQNPRRIACLTLVSQEKNGYSNLVLSSALQKNELTLRDKAFVSAVFYGTIERCITLDAILAQHLSKPLSRLDAEVRAVLRMGLYQALYMDGVPQSAAVNESVKLVRQLGKNSAASLVNAVLRKACAFDAAKFEYKNELHRLSVIYSVSESVAKVFCNTFKENAENELAALFVKPRLCIRVNILKTTAEELKQKLLTKDITCEEGFVPNSLYLSSAGDITKLAEFKNGLFHVQGEASQFACYALGPIKGAKVLDLCAAPGGKSATLAQYMENEGCLISADFAKNRLSLIEELFKRNGVNCAKIIHADAATYCKEYEEADFVLCDVPCSGLGTINKKPDIRTKNLDNIDELVKTQKQILNTASKYVKKGGRLVYSTCTINFDENEGVVNSFLSENDSFSIIKPSNIVPVAAKAGDFAFFTPYKTKTDGFYVATLERL